MFNSFKNYEAAGDINAANFLSYVIFLQNNPVNL